MLADVGELMSDFKSMILGEFPVDPTYELYVKAWEAYYKAADEIDGHIKHPMSKGDYKTISRAGYVGKQAFNEVRPDGDRWSDRSRSARDEVLRRMNE